MSQLARQLYVSVGQWMGMRDIPDPVLRENRRSERVGTPSGFLTSVARASWNMPRKDREDLVHHMVDAVTLSFIPPGPGLNSVRYGGIFYDQFQAESGKTRVCALPVGPDPEVVEALTASDASTCPVVHFRSKSSKSSMHDQTLLGMRADGRLASRIPFDAKKGQMDVVSLRQRLINEGIRSDLIPADRVMEAWLESPPGTPFRLANGQRVRRQTLFASKEKTVFPGLGLVASHSSAGAWSTIKIFDAGKYQGAELWRVWVPKRKKWDFIIRRVPDRRAMESLLRICFRWFGSLSETERAIIPEGISARITKLEMHLKSRPIHWKRLSSGISARKCLKLFVQAGFPIRGTEAAAWQEVEKAIYGDSLPEGAVPVISHLTGHPARIVKGQSFLISVTSGGKRAEPGRPTEKHWYRVSSIKGDGGIKIKALRMREWDEMVLSKVDVAALFGAKPSDDPPSDPSE
jgi:hypothetical protein